MSLLRRHATLTVLGAALITAAGTARLGVWQLDRAAQKVALQQRIEVQAQLPVLTDATLAREPAALDAQLQRRVVLQGQWRPSATVFLDNRTMNGRTGFLVITPLVLRDGDAIAVQRGWVPRDQRDRTLVPDATPPAGPVEVTGRLAAWPSALYDFGAGASGPIRQNIDRSAYAQEAGLRLLPLSVQQLSSPEASPANDALQRDWPAPAIDVQKHYGYAAQWFALSALVVGLTAWFQWLRPRRQARRAQAGLALSPTDSDPSTSP